ncbi:metallophosphoesterase [Tissierella sp.]|uniref:metallophosphoesterase family protein n=1 Tax=Tissierella sp. TaxID=41274 RepID=UPI00285AC21F|nr:metallophosphoesterase [Tissierella sp.]MDR7855129.1 metallophosphoesterase [Tissierella sp.]
MIKIFHTADLHIGMRFNGYPEPIKGSLQEARLSVLSNMVQLANEEKCNLFVIAGDLFDRITGIDKKTITEAVKALEAFQGDCILVMPGNHDYDNDMIELWNSFNKAVCDKLLYINEKRPYSLNDYGLNAIVYPAPCHAKHSSSNNIGWIKEHTMDENQVHIGVGHGAINGLSPDMDLTYYNMSLDELESIPVDLWLLGHTHITYPPQSSVNEWKTFNPGTPEPDGLDCKHRGSAWIISIDEGKKVRGDRVTTGTYKFVDKEYDISHREDLDAILIELMNDNPSRTISRINLKGKVDEDVFNYRQEIYKKIEQDIAYLIVDDSHLGIKITTEKIQKEFSDGSFPQQLLLALSDDEDTLQLAYEFIMEVKK